MNRLSSASSPSSFSSTYAWPSSSLVRSSLKTLSHGAVGVRIFVAAVIGPVETSDVGQGLGEGAIAVSANLLGREDSHRSGGSGGRLFALGRGNDHGHLHEQEPFPAVQRGGILARCHSPERRGEHTEQRGEEARRSHGVLLRGPSPRRPEPSRRCRHRSDRLVDYDLPPLFLCQEPARSCQDQVLPSGLGRVPDRETEREFPRRRDRACCSSKNRARSDSEPSQGRIGPRNGVGRSPVAALPNACGGAGRALVRAGLPGQLTNGRSTS